MSKAEASSIRNLPNLIEAMTHQQWLLEKNYFLRMSHVFRDALHGANGGGGKFAKADNRISYVDTPCGMVINEPEAAASDLVIAESQRVAIVPVRGSLFRNAGIMEASGAFSMSKLRDTIRMIDSDPAIKGTVLIINSPGGTVDGTEELANVIWNSSKPIVTVVENMAASAAYWIASQTDTIFMSESTANVGSIGVVLTHHDYSQWYQRVGVKITYVTNEEADEKVVAPDSEPLSDRDLRILKRELGDIASIFHSAVKRGRSDVSADLFNGATYLASDAIKNGLADKMGGLDEAIKRVAFLSSRPNFRRNNQNAQAMSKQTQKTAQEGAQQQEAHQATSREDLVQAAKEGNGIVALTQDQLDERLAQARAEGEASAQAAAPTQPETKPAATAQPAAPKATEAPAQLAAQVAVEPAQVAATEQPAAAAAPAPAAQAAAAPLAAAPAAPAADNSAVLAAIDKLTGKVDAVTAENASLKDQLKQAQTTNANLVTMLNGEGQVPGTKGTDAQNAQQAPLATEDPNADRLFKRVGAAAHSDAVQNDHPTELAQRNAKLREIVGRARGSKEAADSNPNMAPTGGSFIERVPQSTESQKQAEMARKGTSAHAGNRPTSR